MGETNEWFLIVSDAWQNKDKIKQYGSSWFFAVLDRAETDAENTIQLNAILQIRHDACILNSKREL